MKHKKGIKETMFKLRMPPFTKKVWFLILLYKVQHKLNDNFIGILGTTAMGRMEELMKNRN